MKKEITLTIITLFFANLCFAQSTIEWQRCLGGSSYDVAHSIQQTSDGGYIVAGISESNDFDVSGNHGWYDYWIVKLYSSGGIEWQRSLGGSNGDYANSIQQTSDAGYIVAGYSASNDSDVSGNHGGLDYWVVKLNSSGNLEWQRSLGGSLNDYAYSIDQTSDGGYIITGESASNDGDVSGNNGSIDYWIVKLDSSGEIEWQRSLGGSFDDVAESIQQTSDGGFIVAGYSASNDGDVNGNHGNGDYWVVKLDSSGSIVWQRSIGGSSYDWAYSVCQTNDDGYIVAGRSYSNDSDVSGHHGTPGDYPDYWVVKLDSSGSIEWQHSLGGTYDDFAYSIHQTNDNGYIVAGYSLSNDGDVSGNHGEYDSWVVKLNSSGSLEWQRSLGGNEGDFAYSIQQTTDNGYIVVGWSRSNDGDVSGHHAYEDYWVVKLSADDGISESNRGLQPLVHTIAVFPNPFNSSCEITAPAGAEVELYDLLGNVVGERSPDRDNRHREMSPTSRTFIWTPAQSITSGIYIVKARTEEGLTATKRIVLIK